MDEPLAKRRLHATALPLLIWFVVTTLASVAGPFGTFEGLPFGPRLAYWAFVAGTSVGGSYALTRLASDWAAPAKAVAWYGFVVLNAFVIYTCNMLIFAQWQGWANYLYILGIVALITVMVHVIVRALRWQAVRYDPVDLPDPAAQFLEKLPFDKRAPLIRIEAQDHYLNVVTDAGEALILMRLSDALHMLSGIDGLQVHRSHWVSAEAVVQHKRTAGRDFLVLRDSAEVPVSRGHKAAVRARGFL